MRYKTIPFTVDYNKDWTDMLLEDIYVISPSIAPRIISEVLETGLGEGLQIPGGRDSNEILLKNPIFFHGMRVQKLIMAFFYRMQESSRIAGLYHAWLRLSQDDFKSRGKSLLEKLALKHSPESNLESIKQLIYQSRLLYSNTTQFLFNVEAEK